VHTTCGLGPGKTVVDLGSGAGYFSFKMASAAAERDINRVGFQVVARNDRSIDRPTENDIWWLLVFRKP
jgi:16S rRNA G1207 methylase RsmC